MTLLAVATFAVASGGRRRTTAGGGCVVVGVTRGRVLRRHRRLHRRAPRSRRCAARSGARAPRPTATLRAEQARLAERARIAREMHDVLAHKVSLIAMHAGALEVQATPTPDQVARGRRAHPHDGARGDGGPARRARRAARRGRRRRRPGPAPRRDDIVRVVEASRAAGVHGPSCASTSASCPTPLARDGPPRRAGGADERAQARPWRGDGRHGRRRRGDGRVASRSSTADRSAAAALLPGSGAGLLGLAERVALLGGTLEAGPSADGGWRLAGVAAVERAP